MQKKLVPLSSPRSKYESGNNNQNIIPNLCRGWQRSGERLEKREVRWRMRLCPCRCWDEHLRTSTQDSFFLSPLCQVGPEQTEDEPGWRESRGRQTVVRRGWSEALLTAALSWHLRFTAAGGRRGPSPLLTPSGRQSEVRTWCPGVCEASLEHSVCFCVEILVKLGN